MLSGHSPLGGLGFGDGISVATSKPRAREHGNGQDLIAEASCSAYYTDGERSEQQPIAVVPQSL